MIINYSYKAWNIKYCFWIVTTVDLPFSIMQISDQMKKKRHLGSKFNSSHYSHLFFFTSCTVKVSVSIIHTFTLSKQNIVHPGSRFSNVVVLTQTQPAGQSDIRSEWTHWNTPLEIWFRLNIKLIVEIWSQPLAIDFFCGCLECVCMSFMCQQKRAMLEIIPKSNCSPLNPSSFGFNIFRR